MICNKPGASTLQAVLLDVGAELRVREVETQARADQVPVQTPPPPLRHAQEHLCAPGVAQQALRKDNVQDVGVNGHAIGILHREDYRDLSVHLPLQHLTEISADATCLSPTTEEELLSPAVHSPRQAGAHV